MYNSLCGYRLYIGVYAGVAQLVRALPCHGRGCGFESRHLRQADNIKADVAQLVEHVIGIDEVSSSILDVGSKKVSCHLSSVGRAILS